MVIVEMTLGPGESRSFNIAWNQTGNGGAAVPANDSYRAVYRVEYIERSFEGHASIFIRDSS